MRLTALFVTLTSTACASFASMPDPVLPMELNKAQADQLYAANQLVCESGSCTQGEEKQPIQAFEDTRYRRARAVMARSRHARNGVSWGMFGIGIGSAAATAMLGSLAAFDDGEVYGPYALISGGISLGMVLGGLLVRALWPTPDESFANAYNAELRAELNKLLALQPAVEVAKKLTPEQRTCMQVLKSAKYCLEK